MANTIGTAWIQVEPEAKGIQSKIEKAIQGGTDGYGKTLSGALGSAAKLGAAAIAGAGTAMAAFGASSVKAGSQFDASMSQVAATMGKTMADMQNEVGSVDLAWGKFSGNLREYAQEMGKNTAFSATEAADALNYMALAGYDTQTSMNMLPNVLNLAAAGNMDLARASDMVTDTQTAFGISLDRTSKMVDEMAKAASTGNTSVEQLGDAFLVVGGLARELNGGMVKLSDGTTKEVDGVQELEIALTAMANAGVKGSEAGTHMRNMLLKLSSPTKEGVEQLEALGVSVYDAQGKMRSLSGIFGDLNGALGNLTQEQKIQAISDLFNTRDIASAEALLNAVGQDWDAIGASILDAEGSAQKMAETQLDNLAGDVTYFKSALEGAQIAVSDQLTPSLREFVQFGTQGLSDLTNAFQEGGISGAMNEFGKILSDGLNMVIEKLPEAVNAGMQLLGAVGQGILDNLPTIIDSAVKIVNMLLEGLIHALPSLADGAVKLVSGLASGISRVLPTLIPMAVNMVLTIAEGLIDNIDLLVQGAIDLVTGLTNGIITALPILIQSLPGIISSVMAALTANLPIIINAIVRICISLVNAIVENLPMFINALVQIVTGLTAAMTENLPLLVNGIVQVVTALANAIIENLPIIIDALIQIHAACAEAMIDNLPVILEGIWQIITGVGGAIVERIPFLLGKLGEVISSLLAKVGESVSEFIAKVTDGGSSIVNEFVKWLSELPDKLAYWAGAAVASFVNFIYHLPENLATILTKVITKAVDFGVKLKDKAIEAAKNFYNYLIDGIKNLPSKISELLNKLINTFKTLPSKLVSIGREVVNGLWNGIREKWDWLKDKVGSLINSFIEGFKDRLDIGSPSKVFAKEIGQWIPAGVALGIEDNSDVLNSSIDQMTSEMLSTNTASDVEGMTRRSFGETAQSGSGAVFNNQFTIEAGDRDGKALAEEIAYYLNHEYQQIAEAWA